MTKLEGMTKFESRNVLSLYRRYFRASTFWLPSSFDIRASSFFPLVNHQFVAVRIAELSHPTNRCLGFLTVERNTALFQLNDRPVDVFNLKRDGCSLAGRFPCRMTANSDCHGAKIVLDPRAFHRRGRGL